MGHDPITLCEPVTQYYGTCTHNGVGIFVTGFQPDRKCESRHTLKSSPARRGAGRRPEGFIINLFDPIALLGTSLKTGEVF